MDMSGEYRIPAARQAVWTALNNPDILRQCIPGCEELTKHSDTEMTAKVTAKIGPVKARFGGKVTLSDFDPPAGYQISGEGNGGAAGFAKGVASVRLVEEGAGTLLRYTVQANIGGKLAQIGARLIDSTVRKMADDFFTRFVSIVGTPDGAAAAVCPAPFATDEAPLVDTASKIPSTQADPASDGGGTNLLRSLRLPLILAGGALAIVATLLLGA